MCAESFSTVTKYKIGNETRPRHYGNCTKWSNVKIPFGSSLKYFYSFPRSNWGTKWEVLSVELLYTIQLGILLRLKGGKIIGCLCS